jgi:hypothetical protein
MVLMYVSFAIFQEIFYHPSGIRKGNAIDTLDFGKSVLQHDPQVVVSALVENQTSVVGNQTGVDLTSARSEIIWSQIQNYFRPTPSKVCWSEIYL